MSHYWFIGVSVLLTVGVAAVFAETKEPANSRELVKVLYDDYGIVCDLGKDGSPFRADILGDRVNDVPAAVKRISNLRTLKWVYISHVRTDAKLLAQLAKLPAIETLEIPGCKFQDEDLEVLKDFPSLRELTLDYTPITDKGLEKLTPLKKLEILSLGLTKVNGSGFTYLESLPLRTLDLSLTPITDESLAAIGKIKTLEGLDLHNTPVSDKGLMHLVGLYRLVGLPLNERITVKGEEAFRRAHAESRADAEQKGLLPKKYPKLQIVIVGPSLDKNK